MKAIEHQHYDFYENLEEWQGKLITPTEGFSGYVTLLALKRSISLYFQSLSRIRCVNNIDWTKADKSYIKAVLNSKYITSKEQETRVANDEIMEIEKKLFLKLEQQPNPYYILLCPIYYFTTTFENKTSGYKKDFGVNDLSLEACERFYKYEINKKNPQIFRKLI